MKLYRKVVMNGFEMEDVSFKREFELEGCIGSNPELLSLDDEEFSEPAIIAMEAFIKEGRKDCDGRADVIVAYSSGKVGVVELKRGEIDKAAYDQLSEYMSERKGLLDVKELKEYMETEDVNIQDNEQIVGVLVGTDISDEVIEELEKRVSGPKMFVIVLTRCKIKHHDVFIFADVHQSAKGKDYTKYVIDKSAKAYGKARMVHEVIRLYVARHPKVTYNELQDIFPKKWRGVARSENGCFIRKAQAVQQKEDSGYTRHFVKDEDIIALADSEIAVSTQWGVGNIDYFVKGVNSSKKIGVKIKTKKNRK